MRNILFASNTVSHFPGAGTSASSWAYDSNRVPYAITAPVFTIIGTPRWLQSTTDEYWFHIRCGSDEWYTNNRERILEVKDTNGATLLYFGFRDSSAYGFYLSVTVDGGSGTHQVWFPWPDLQARTFDIQLKFNALSVEARTYMNEILINEVTYAIAGFNHPAYGILGGFTGYSGAGTFYFSEFIVADADTRNARLDLLRPTAVGAYSNWDGAVITLSDDDPTTGMTTLTALQSQSTILTPYTGAANISNVVQVTTSVRGINSPTQLQHLVRLSAVDYLTASFAVPEAKDYQITDWPQNPATTSPWAAADLANAEFGFKSIA